MLKHTILSSLDQLQTLIIPRKTVKKGSEILILLEETTVLQMLHLGMAYRWGDEVALYDGDDIFEGLKCISNMLEKLYLGVEYYPFTLWEYSIAQELGRQEHKRQFPGIPEAIP